MNVLVLLGMLPLLLAAAAGYDCHRRTRTIGALIRCRAVLTARRSLRMVHGD